MVSYRCRECGHVSTASTHELALRKHRDHNTDGHSRKLPARVRNEES